MLRPRCRCRLRCCYPPFLLPPPKHERIRLLKKKGGAKEGRKKFRGRGLSPSSFPSSSRLEAGYRTEKRRRRDFPLLPLSVSACVQGRASFWFSSSSYFFAGSEGGGGKPRCALGAWDGRTTQREGQKLSGGWDPQQLEKQQQEDSNVLAMVGKPVAVAAVVVATTLPLFSFVSPLAAPLLLLLCAGNEGRRVRGRGGGGRALPKWTDDYQTASAVFQGWAML